MMKVGMVGGLLAVGTVIVSACAPGAPTLVEQTGMSELPLDTPCIDCVEQAISGTCNAELELCLEDPGCLDVSACFEGCAADDLGCFMDCILANETFDSLLGCAICAPCEAECNGQLPACGDPIDPQDPVDPLDPSEPVDPLCEKCALDQIEMGFCPDAEEACQDDPGCAALQACLDTCGLDQTCIESCVNVGSETSLELFGELLDCALCDGDCAEECVDVSVCDGGGDPSDPGDPGDCLDDFGCALCVIDEVEAGACGAEVDACLNDADCGLLAECAMSCAGFEQCIQLCAGDVGAEGAALFDELLGCAACGPCQDACDETGVCN
jgi:hypothetical protein